MLDKRQNDEPFLADQNTTFRTAIMKDQTDFTRNAEIRNNKTTPYYMNENLMLEDTCNSFLFAI